MMTSVFYMCRASWEMQLDGALGQVLAWLQQTQISSAAFYDKVGVSLTCLQVPAQSHNLLLEYPIQVASVRLVRDMYACDCRSGKNQACARLAGAQRRAAGVC